MGYFNKTPAGYWVYIRSAGMIPVVIELDADNNILFVDVCTQTNDVSFDFDKKRVEINEFLPNLNFMESGKVVILDVDTIVEKTCSTVFDLMYNSPYAMTDELIHMFGEHCIKISELQEVVKQSQVKKVTMAELEKLVGGKFEIVKED